MSWGSTEKEMQDANDFPALIKTCDCCRGNGTITILEKDRETLKNETCPLCKGARYIPTEVGEMIILAVKPYLTGEHEWDHYSRCNRVNAMRVGDNVFRRY